MVDSGSIANICTIVERQVSFVRRPLGPDMLLNSDPAFHVEHREKKDWLLLPSADRENIAGTYRSKDPL
jgi:hypothetical protein